MHFQSKYFMVLTAHWLYYAIQYGSHLEKKFKRFTEERFKKKKKLNTVHYWKQERN